MRGKANRQRTMIFALGLKDRVYADRPLWAIRSTGDWILVRPSGECDAATCDIGFFNLVPVRFLSGTLFAFAPPASGRFRRPGELVPYPQRLDQTMRGILSSLLLVCLVSIGLAGTPAMAQADAETGQVVAEWHLLDPPWVSPTIYRESVLLLQETDGGPLVGRLAFPVEELIEVRAADGSRRLKPGTDFQIGSDRRTLQFAATSDVPFVKTKDLFLPNGSPDSYAHRTGHPEQSLMFHPGKWFHSRQFEVTYRRPKVEWLDTAPALATQSLPRTLELLQSGKPLKLVVAGDSIAAGGDASRHADIAPHMPAFPELVAAQLQETYGSPVTLKNLAVGGTSISHGVASLEKYVAEQPDLLIIAFGMNDVGRRDPAWFKAETQKLIAGVKEALPKVEIVLVAPMIGNAEWVHTPREMFPKYRDALAELTGSQIALADLTSVWALLLKHKHELDMTGNGLNHPNDFGHRLYAQTILGLLVPASKGR